MTSSSHFPRSISKVHFKPVSWNLKSSLFLLLAWDFRIGLELKLLQTHIVGQSQCTSGELGWRFCLGQTSRHCTSEILWLKSSIVASLRLSLSIYISCLAKSCRVALAQPRELNQLVISFNTVLRFLGGCYNSAGKSITHSKWACKYFNYDSGNITDNRVGKEALIRAFMFSATTGKGIQVSNKCVWFLLGDLLLACHSSAEH